ncbi:MAG: translocation/assembly module TamB domain-containing protein, partial [Flavobacteriaceae bacterium]
ILGRPKVELNEQTFRFTPAIISDNVHGTRGTLRGTLSHEMFEKWYLDLAIRTDNLLVLNTEEKEDVEYYGTGFMEGSATIRGYTDELVIDVVGTTKPGTEFIIPLSDISTVSDSKLINFITNVEEQENLSKTQEVIFDKLKGLTLNFDLTVTKDAIAEIVIDKNTGSVLRGSGDGNMLIEINTNGKFDIYGSYVVDNGVYEFRNIVNKDFNVKPGGLVVWNGNPYDAFLNITAVYNTKANPSVLLENVGDSRRKIDVDLIAKITGQLLDSDIEYDVQLPNQNSVVNSELQFKMSDEYVKMTQFFSLLTTGSFVNLDEGIFNNNSGNAFLNRTASEKISNVLADLFKTKGDKFQMGVTVDLANKEDVRSYQLDDQLGVSFSSTIGKTVSVNGRVGVPVGGNTQSAIFGEVEVALPLNEEGTLTARAYTKQNDVEYDITDAEGYTHGVGISWRVDFDNSKELFKKLFSKKEKDSIAKRIKRDTLKTRTNLINFQTQQKDSVNQKK